MKFGRFYEMIVEGKEETHTISFPLTCRFQVKNAALPYGAQTTFFLYNLSPQTRRDLQKDFYEIGDYKPIQFRAGYQSEGPTLPLIFQGNVKLAYSYRLGPDWITEITAFDGAFARENAFTTLSIPAPYKIDKVWEGIIEQAKSTHLTLGAIGTFDSKNYRGIAYTGNSWEYIVESARAFDCYVVINKEKAYILNQDEYIKVAGTINAIDADHGLLDSPRHQGAQVRCRMIFEPRFEMFQLVELNSIEPGNSGTFQILRVDHTGTISGAVCENLITEVYLIESNGQQKLVEAKTKVAIF